MGRLINLVLFGGVLLGAFWLYQVKQQARETEGQIATLQHQIAVEKEALLLLKAEWSYLNRPERVQNLAKRFADQLGLKEVKAYQIGEDADLPERVASRDGAGDAGPETIDELLGKASTRPKPMKQ
ncbi:cell division protein FtsL [Cohaesibacter gelatinilyticus]|uniref:Cell division protein FtsL n=1 Tax=Cohaesibacter gelatinilyticus TaxID=372072 RepID=A0A285NMK2_9HYPH|nr:hypothetical protein [Cohaesibacter gelatinilyticus]SNZ09086.1 cell division protein FtsL [Cohaesibacter gelatinilyticus]